MLAVPGGRYKVRFRLSGPMGADPSWLVGAVRATWGGMDVVDVRRTGRQTVVATVRASRRAHLNVGDVVEPVTQGISVPGLRVPGAEVDQVQPVALPAARELPLELEPGLSDEAPTGWGVADAFKLAASVGLIGVTVWLSRRIQA